MTKSYVAPDKDFICRTFDSISPRYDLLNRILSLGASDGWRQKAKDVLEREHLLSGDSILDLGVGTGDFLKCFMEVKPWTRAVGLDFSTAMLERARMKLPLPVELQAGDFHELSFPDASFDLILSAFTLRSVQDMPRFLGGIFRVLKPGGRVAFLELTRPRNFLLKLFFIPYVKIYLPLVGRWVSGNDTAYRFLSESVRHFQSPSVVMERMEKAGFSELSTKSFSFGTATLIIGRK